MAFRRRGVATVLDDLRQAGCLKARFPRVEQEAWTTVVALNTSGGVAGGDRLDSAFAVQEGACATITAQAAERFYRVLPESPPSQVRTRIAVADGGAAEWLPQETILFDRCALDRRLEVDLGHDAWFLGVESLVFGRAAMGESVQHGWIRDLIHVRHNGRLLLHDAVRLDGEVAAALRRKAIADGARAVATIVHIAPGAEQLLDRLRSALTDQPVESGASAWNGMVLQRIMAHDGAALRAAVTAPLGMLRARRPLPRVWQC